MTNNSLENAQAPLAPQIGISLLLHLLVAAIGLFKVFLFPSQPLIYNEAIRVDLVGLPEKRQETPAVAPSSPKSMPAPQKAPPQLNDKPKVDIKKEESDAIARIKALQKIEEQARQAKREEAAKKIAALQKYKGNVISPGSRLGGIDQLQHDEYISTLNEQVKKNWVLPQWLSSANLHARVLVQIDQNGNILSRKIVQSSQNEVFDQKALESIDRAAPFPKPPEKFAKILEASGVEFGFPD